MKKLVIGLCCLLAFSVEAQDSLNVQKLGHLAYGPRLSDVWGYADTAGNEYALVGALNGFSIVDVSNAANPQELHFIPGAYSIWRDIKTWSHYAYVVHDGYFFGNSDGILIVDMDSVHQAKPKFKRFFPSLMVDTNVAVNFDRAHNVYIDENGVLYVFGSNLGEGGALMFDLTLNPETPQFLGYWNEYYLHDGVARGDTLWGAAVLDGRFHVIDVSNKANPQTLARQSTPNAFTHNIWFSDDNKTVYTTDEVSGAYVASYDVSDLNNITELDRIQSVIGNGAVIPHNAHVYGDFLVNSYYTSGLQIVDATFPDILVEVGYYDSSDSIGDGFNGAWGAYPYLPSGNILITDIQEGLFVLQADYLKACYLDITVVDSVTKLAVPGASISIAAANQQLMADIFGKARTGVESPATYELIVSKNGYRNDTISVNLQRGIMDSLRVPLVPNNIGLAELDEWKIDLYPNPATAEVIIHSAKEKIAKIEFVDFSGKTVLQHFPNTTKCNLELSLQAGVYQVFILGENGTKTVKSLSLVR